jgi:hypothetical protein
MMPSTFGMCRIAAAAVLRARGRNGSAPDPEWSQTPAIRVAVRTLMGGALVNPTRQLEASAEPSLRNPRHVLA